MAGRGIAVLGGLEPAAVTRKAESYVLHFANVAEPAIEAGGFDALIWAVGRDANTQTLDLAAAGIRVDRTGHVEADDWQNTNVAGVHAVGDVTGRLALTPVAVAAGRRLADRLFGGKAGRAARLHERADGRLLASAARRPSVFRKRPRASCTATTSRCIACVSVR